MFVFGINYSNNELNILLNDCLVIHLLVLAFYMLFNKLFLINYIGLTNNLNLDVRLIIFYLSLILKSEAEIVFTI